MKTTMVRHTLTFAAAISVCGVLAACGLNKIAQCNKLIEKVNTAQTTAVDGIKKLDGKDDSKDLADLATSFDTMKTAIVGVDLNDDKLKGLQKDYAAAIDKTSAAARAQKAALDKSDAAGAAAANTDLQAGIAAQSKVIDGINGYCGGTP